MTHSLPSARFQRYELVSVLGRGGMGVVYAAFDRERGHEVALKCLSIERFEVGKPRERAHALFEREYHILSQLAHPHIIRAFDYGHDEHGPFYTMERLSGESLRARAPVNWRIACTMLRDIASALALVHSRSFVHRDVTPLNIQCTPDWRATLIDFGAMMPAGLAKHLIGTPPYVPPECLHLQSLDGQTDLFALGASLYYAITGQNAYPARSLTDLQTIWLKSPPAPSQLTPGIPRALDDLVLSLVSLQQSDRPRTAAEVYERLTGIAGLPRTEDVESARAFFTRPPLVGRAPVLELLRRRAEKAFRGNGSAIVLRGEHGLGRSRLLDAAALEAKVTGFHVARAEATHARGDSLATAKDLIAALAAEHADLAQRLASLHSSDAVAAVTLDKAQRERSLRGLTETLLEACSRAPCALIVDDLEAIDDATCALLAGLAEQAHAHALWIVCSVEQSAPLTEGSALGLLWSHARPVQLEPLNATESRALLASMFGDEPNIDVLSLTVHRRCEGNPRDLMDSARRLIDQGLLRYTGGSWSIANEPEAIARAIDDQHDVDQRLSRLSDEARELLEAIACDRYAAIDAAYYPELLGHTDRARMHAALQNLVAERWVALHEDGARFVRGDLRDAVAARTSPAHRQQLHARLATRCREQGLPAVFEAHHRLAAGQPEQALLAMDEFDAFVDKHPTAEVLHHPVTLETTDAVSRMPPLPGAHPAMRAKYSAATLLNATYVGRSELVAARMSETLTMLAQFSGMDEYRELKQLEPGERLMQALTRAAARCDRPGAGALDVVNALRRQTQLCITGAVIANFMADIELLTVIPDLTPFHPLSPALPIASRMIDALSKLARGQLWLAWDALEAVYAELRSPSAEQLEPLTRMALERTTIGYLCGLGVEHGASSVLPLIQEYAPAIQDLGESQRGRYWLALGDLNAAAAARRRFEVLSVRAGGLSEARVSELPVHLSIYALCNDVLGLRRTLRAIEDVLPARPGWRSRAAIAKAQLARCQGQYEDGLRVIEALMSTLRPPHPDFHQAAAAHLELLLAARRHRRAIACGFRYLRAAKHAELPVHRIEIALALALAKDARHAEAEPLFSEALARLELRGASGVLLGCVYEAGARIALARADRVAFEARAQLCEEQFRLGRHPGTTVRYNALMRDAERDAYPWRSNGNTLRNSLAPLETRVESLLQLAAQPVDDTVFYRELLELILESTAAVGGVLYRGDQGSPVRVAIAGALANRSDIDELVMSRFSGVDAEVAGCGEGLYVCVLEDEAHGDKSRLGALILDTGGTGPQSLSSSSLRLAAQLLAARARGGTQLGSVMSSELAAVRHRSLDDESATQELDAVCTTEN